jgi:hypothetical protein
MIQKDDSDIHAFQLIVSHSQRRRFADSQVLSECFKHVLGQRNDRDQSAAQNSYRQSDHTPTVSQENFMPIHINIDGSDASRRAIGAADCHPLLSWRSAPVHQAAAAGNRPREQARVYVSR